MCRGGAGCLYGALKCVAGVLRLPEFLERAAQPIQAFRIELAAAGIFLKFRQRLFGAP